MITNKFDFKLIDNFLGYNSSGDKTTIDPRYMIRGSKNVYKKLSGTLASREGLKRRGSQDSTNAGVKSSFEWTTSIGTFRALRICNGKLEVESDIASSGTYVWYELKETSTLASLAGTYTRFDFATWWDADDNSDRLIMVRGDSKLLYWSGAMALVDSTTATTITKQGTETWAESGFAITLTAEKKIIIDGKEVTYTGGTNTTTLTGCTISSGSVTDLTSGMVAIQSVLSKAGGADSDMFPSTFKADFIKVIENQLVVFSYTSRNVYIGASSTAGGVLGFLNFTNSGSLIPGDPDTITLDSVPTAVGEKDGKMIVFGGTSDMYVITPNFNLPVSFDNEYVTWKVEKKVLPTLNAAQGNEFVGNFNDYLVWLDQNNQLRALGGFTNESIVKPVSLSVQVQQELIEDDFTGGHLKVVNDTIHITAPNNGRDWMYQIRDKVNEDGSVSSEKIWQPPQIRGIQRFAVIDGVLHGHSNVNPQIFQVENTNQWFDDGFLDGNNEPEEIPYTSVIRFPYRSHEKPQGLLKPDMIFVEGYMPQGVELGCKIYFNYQGAAGTRDLVVSNDTREATFFSGTKPPSMGDSSSGDNPFGDGILEETSDQDLVPKFKAILNIPQAKDCFEYSLEVYCTEEDGRFELLRIGTNASLASQNAVSLRK